MTVNSNDSQFIFVRCTSGRQRVDLVVPNQEGANDYNRHKPRWTRSVENRLSKSKIDGTPSAFVWPSPRQTPGPSCPYSSG